MKYDDIKTWKDSGGSYAICVIGGSQFLLDSNYPDTLNVYKVEDQEEFLPENLLETLSIRMMLQDEIEIYRKMIIKMMYSETNQELISVLENCFTQASSEKRCRDMVRYGKLIARIDFDETEDYKTYRIYLDPRTGIMYRLTMRGGQFLNIKVIDLDNLSYLILNNKEYLSYLGLTYLKEVK